MWKHGSTKQKTLYSQDLRDSPVSPTSKFQKVSDDFGFKLVLFNIAIHHQSWRIPVIYIIIYLGLPAKVNPIWPIPWNPGWRIEIATRTPIYPAIQDIQKFQMPLAPHVVGKSWKYIESLSSKLITSNISGLYQPNRLISTKQAYIYQPNRLISTKQAWHFHYSKNRRPVPGRGVVDTARVEAVLVPRVVGRGDKVLTVKNCLQ